MQNATVNADRVFEEYECSEDFFELFEADTFTTERKHERDGVTVKWEGFVDGELCAGYDFESNIGWTTL